MTTLTRTCDATCRVQSSPVVLDLKVHSKSSRASHAYSHVGEIHADLLPYILTASRAVLMSALPAGFTAIKDAKVSGTIVNFLGIVVSLEEPRKTKGTDWSLNFTIQDDFTASAVGGSSSINCRVFMPTETTLPKFTGAGDVVILRNFKLSAWRGRIDCLSFPGGSGVLVFPADKIPVREMNHAFLLGTSRLPYHSTNRAREPSITEQRAVLTLKHSSAGSAQDVQQHASMATFNAKPRRKETLIQDLTFDKFYDMKVQVVNVYYSHNGTVDLKVTDYTANKDLHPYADPETDPDLVVDRGWPGPYGQVTMDIRLYEPHAAWARGTLTRGDFIYLRNVHTRTSAALRLEGALHQDRQNQDQLDISKLRDHSAIEEINKRKDAHERQRSNRATVHFANVPKKPSAKASAKKRFERKERQRLQKETVLKEIEKNEESWQSERSGINMNGTLVYPGSATLVTTIVRAGFPEVQLSTLSEIINNPHLRQQTSKYNNITLPFVNCRHRSRVRIVDFYPPELEYFAHSLDDPSWTPRSKSKSNRPWEWAFVLLVEDANVPRNTVPEQLRVIVNNDAAQYLGLPNARE